jgi:hypothetical protein
VEAITAPVAIVARYEADSFKSKAMESNIWSLKMLIRIQGTVLRDFRPSFFSFNGTPGSPDSRGKAVLNTYSNSRRISIRFDYRNRLPVMPHSAESIFFVDKYRLTKKPKGKKIS